MFNWDLLVPIAGMATGLVLLMPIVRAGVRYLERRGSDAGTTAELAEMREELRMVHERVDAMEIEAHRIAELEERLDFTERVLAQQQSKGLKSGGMGD